MLTEKYLAGFIDADGYIGIRARIGSKPDCDVELTQREQYREVLDDLMAMFGGSFRIREAIGDRFASVCLRGGPAAKLIERLSKYAVIKGPWMQAALELVRNAPVLQTQEQVVAFRRQWKLVKRKASSTERNYPSRKWLAGYFDGDGSFVAYKGTSGAYVRATIMSEPHLACGIRLIQKAFGGHIVEERNNLLWHLQMPPSKINQFVGYMADDLVIKKAQAYYLLHLAQGGNLRDGETIRQHMKEMNAQQHRLSDPAGHAAALARTVRFDLPSGWQKP